MGLRTKEKTLALPQSHQLVKDSVFVMLFATLTAVGAWIEIRLPFTPVPLTMQTFFVLLSGSLLGWKRGMLSQLTYLGIGLAGFPVFSGGAAGWSWLFCASGGFLISFPFAAMIAGLLTARSYSFVRNFYGMLTATLIIMISGFFGLMLFVPDVSTAFQWGVLPFIAGDVLKATAAAGAMAGIRLLRRSA